MTATLMQPMMGMNMGTPSMGGMMPNMGTMSASTGTPNLCMVPTCTMKMEKCTGGMKVTCACPDAVMCATLQNLCKMMSMGMCSFCCMMNGMVMCQCNMCLCKCECTMTKDGCCITCTSGDKACCDMLQACCDCLTKCMESGCVCCCCFNGMPCCCGTC